jgi:hypothetical protein
LIVAGLDNKSKAAFARGMVKHPKLPKRPRDLNQWAKHMVDIATGEIEDREPTPEEQGKNPAAEALGKLGGSARAKRLSAKRRTEIARAAAMARYDQKR